MDDEISLEENSRRLQNEDEDGVPNSILFVFCFFTIWNMIICAHTVKACTGLFQGRFNEAAPTLFCPHWIVGIAIPMYVGYSWYGVPGLILLMIPFLVPHTIGIFWLRRRGGGPHGPGGALAVGAATNDEDDSNQANGGSDPGDLRGMTEEERMAYLDEILIIKKVICGGGGKSGADADVTPNDDEPSSSSFRARNPKSDITVAEEDVEMGMVDEVFASVNGSVHDEESARICSICLEEYKVNEEVCWSKNPDCSHVFHKNCLVDWLLTDKSCPNCRQSYVGDFSQQSEPEP